jgi:iron complex transport system substrate-binding protein
MSLNPIASKSKFSRTALRHGIPIWMLTFIWLGLISFAALRPIPRAPEPAGERVVVDRRGKMVHIALPFRGALLTDGAYVPTYLEITRDPESLLAVTSPAMLDRFRGHIIAHIFPNVLARLESGASERISRTYGPKNHLESLLLFDPGVVMGWYTLADWVERVGIPFLGFKTFPRSDEDRAHDVRIYADTVGKNSRGEAIIAYDRNAFEDLDHELKPDQLAYKPRYLYVGSNREGGAVSVLGATNHYTRLFMPYAGVVNACSCPGNGAIVDAEHIIADDPDIIVLDAQNRETPSEFVKDPRWAGLKAVRDHKVYKGPRGLDVYMEPVFWSRWLAELAHPDIIGARSRDLYRSYVEWLLGYSLSDAELDQAFAVDNNRGMANAERFEARRIAR